MANLALVMMDPAFDSEATMGKTVSQTCRMRCAASGCSGT